MKIHTIAGLPRSGSTLLCNVLNQNPRFWATTTSPLPTMFTAIGGAASRSIEYKELINREQDKYEKLLIDSMKAFVEAWCGGFEKEVVFDKSRAWSSHALSLGKIFPGTKTIVVVRDLRNVFASVEKQHLKNPILNDRGNHIAERVDGMFSPQGLIGACIKGVEDLILRNVQSAYFVKYENLSANPKMTMQNIYTEIGEPYYEHDFDNVECTAEDPDGHYLNKFPHVGAGKIEPSDPDEYKKYIPENMAENIMNSFQDFNMYFGYK